MFERTPRPSWSIRAAKLLSPSSEMVLIRFSENFEVVELVHGNDIDSRALLESAQMAIARVLGVLR